MHQPEFKLIGIIVGAGGGLMMWILALALVAWLIQSPPFESAPSFAGSSPPSSVNGSI